MKQPEGLMDVWVGGVPGHAALCSSMLQLTVRARARSPWGPVRHCGVSVTPH